MKLGNPIIALGCRLLQLRSSLGTGKCLSLVRAKELLLQSPPRDKTGNIIHVGTRVRLLQLSGKWLEELPSDEKQDVLSMIGEVFEVEEIDEYGQPWIRKSWPNEEDGTCNSHSIALDPHEMEVVHAQTL